MRHHDHVLRASLVLLAACTSAVAALTPAEVESDLRGGGMQSLRMGACGLVGQYFEVTHVEDIALIASGAGRTIGTAKATVTNRTVLR